MRYARIYPWRRTRRSRAPSNGPEAFFVAQFSAGYTTNMFGFDLRQGQALIAAGSTAANAAVALRRSITVVRAKARNLGTPFQIVAEDRRRLRPSESFI